METKPTDPTPDEEEHAEYNPSSLKLWEMCPSYMNREDQSVHPAAAMGTRLHNALETGDTTKLEGEQELELYHQTQKVVDNLITEHFGKDTVEVHNEIRLVIDIEHGETTFGTCDKLVLSSDGKKGVAMDYKMGLMAVDDAAYNAQVAAYSAGIFQKYPDLEELIFYLIIPRQDEISKGEFDRSIGVLQALRTGTTIRRAQELGGVDFNPQINLCEFCGRQGTCQALAKMALTVGQQYADEKDDAFPIPDKIRGDEHEDPEEIAKLLNLANLLDGWAKGIRGQARIVAFEEGWDIPGFKKIDVKTKRSINNPAVAMSLLGEETQFGLTIPEFLECVSGVSIGKLETAIKAKAPQGEKAKACEDATDVLRDAEVLTGGDGSFGQLRIDRNYKK